MAMTQVHRGSTFFKYKQSTNNRRLESKQVPIALVSPPTPQAKKKIKTTTTNKPEGMTDILVKLLYFLLNKYNSSSDVVFMIFRKLHPLNQNK